MKFLYGINTNGQGHITRSKSIINQLLKEGHQVDTILSGPKPPKYAYNYKPFNPRIISLPGWPLVQKGTRVDIAQTILTNTRGVLSISNTVSGIHKLLEKENYDIIITDFDPHTSRLGKLMNIPTISVDNQHSVIHPRMNLSPLNPFQRTSLAFLLKLTIPYNTYYFALDFIQTRHTTPNGCLHPILELPKLKGLNQDIDNHYLVYIPGIAPKNLYKIFSRFPSEKFIVYGYNQEWCLNNIFFKYTSRQEFLQDMATAKGIISHGGFTIMSEAVMLGKPILSIPVEPHHEQLMNAFRAQQLGLGLMEKNLTAKILSKFLSFCRKDNYCKNTKIRQVPIESFVSILIHKIQELLD